MTIYRIVEHKNLDTGKSRYTCQKKGWFFWHDLKECTHSSKELGPHFSRIWTDSFREAQKVIAEDRKRNIPDRIVKTNYEIF